MHRVPCARVPAVSIEQRDRRGAAMWMPRSGSRGQLCICGKSRACQAAPDPLEEEITARELTHVINNFLRSLPEADRDIFLRRYWYLDREKEIAARHGRTVNGIKASLYRSRKKLYKRLQAEKWISGKKGEHYESEAF